MSRIAGLVAQNAPARIGGMVAALSAGVAVPPRAARTLDVSAAMSLAATSHRETVTAVQHGHMTVVLDGAVYNRADLGAPDGKPVDDARLIAEMTERYGFPGALARINGDFAIALHDARDGALWLARDRMGVKPLFYATAPGVFAFASRPKPLIALPEVGSAVNTRFAAVFAAAHYRYFDNVPTESPYQNVSQLPAAHWLKWDGTQVRVECYWALEDAPDWTASEADLSRQYRDLLLSAVDLRFKSVERPAFTLSGGMDSSSVLACAVERSGVNQQAYSTVYTDKTFDETDEIAAMLPKVAKWNAVPVDNPNVFALVERMIAVNDEPVATATWLSHFLLCERAAGDGVGALFGGLGGDELNAGEYEHFFYHFADLAKAGRTADLDHEVACWARHHDHPIHRKNMAVARAMIGRCTDQARPGVCMPDPARMQRYYAALDPGYFDLAGFHPVMEAPFTSYLKTRTYQDLSRETAPCCLRAEDRQTNAFGLDNVVPFFDHRLVEFMFRVPGHLKIRDGVTKILLREAMTGILPDETRTRIKKTGWNAPAHLWFSGADGQRLLDLVHSKRFAERGIYNVAEVQRLAAEHTAIVTGDLVRENHMMFFWQLVNVETWLETARTQ